MAFTPAGSYIYLNMPNGASDGTTSGVFAKIRAHSNNETTIHGGLTSSTEAWINYRDSNVYQYDMGNGLANAGFSPIKASAFNLSSTREVKPRMYRHKDRNDIKLGILAEEAPIEILDFSEEWYTVIHGDPGDPETEKKRAAAEPGKGVDIYSWTTLNSAALRETQLRLEEAQAVIEVIQNRVTSLEARGV